MAEMSALDFLILGGIALALSLAVAWLVAWLGPRPLPPARPETSGAVRHFLFREERLLDTDTPGFALPDPLTPDESDWSRFRRWLGPRFADPGPATGTPPQTLPARGEDPARLTLSRDGPCLRVSLADSTDCATTRHDLLHRLHAAQTRSAALAALPLPVWQRDADGRLLWENPAARALPEPDRAQLLAARETGRVVIEAGPRWYDLTIRAEVDGETVHASDVTAIVLAEHARRDFVQTLGRTFADLPTGLAVFDQNRALAIFNPAFIDLTGLDPVFLSGRPDILAVFDMLRNRQAMPEPKSYSAWRAEIEAMIRAAGRGQYQEVWSLAGGLAYRVTGRPHPDGAVAFLFENISDEIAATRDQRAALDLRVAALDRVEEGVAVLAADGKLTFCNRRFAKLSGLGPAARSGLAASDLLAACRVRFPRETLWQAIETRLAAGGAPALRERAALDRGADLTVRLMPLGQGQTMLALHLAPASAAPTALSA